MKRADIWMPLVIGDYLADTSHLSTVEHGAYLLLLMHHWRVGPLPDDDKRLAAIARMPRDKWGRIAPAIRAFFTPTATGLVQKRLMAERAEASRISEKRRSSGAKGGHSKAANALKTPETGVANASDLPEQKARPSPSPPTVSTSVDTCGVGAAPPPPTHQGAMLFPIDGGKASRAEARDKAKGSRIREDWQPTADDVAFAEGLGLNATATADRFRDFWIGVAGERGRKVQWSATWRNWCRKDAERASSPPPAGSRPRPLSRQDQANAAAARMLAELDAAEAPAEPRTVKATVL